MYFPCCVVKLSDISDDYFEITCVVIHVCYNFGNPHAHKA